MNGPSEASGGFLISMVAHRCRVCGSGTKVGVKPYAVDGERALCPVNHRLCRAPCTECGVERPLVLDAPEIDAPRSGNPIDDIVFRLESDGGQR